MCILISLKLVRKRYLNSTVTLKREKTKLHCEIGATLDQLISPGNTGSRYGLTTALNSAINKGLVSYLILVIERKAGTHVFKWSSVECNQS